MINNITWKLLNNVLLPLSANKRLLILIFHRVRPEFDDLRPGEITKTEFEELIEFLTDKFNVLPLPDALNKLNTNQLPKRSLSITFDDGYADNNQIAMPVLLDKNVNATFFIATEFLNDGIMWNDVFIELFRSCRGQFLDLTRFGLDNYKCCTTLEKVSSIEQVIDKIKYYPYDKRTELISGVIEQFHDKLPADLMMTNAQVREMANRGMVIGGHTISHPILKKISNDLARNEIAVGKENVEEIIGQTIDYFAYPNGRPGSDYTIDHVGMVKSAGYKGAVSTAVGAATFNSDQYQLPRFTPWDKNLNKFGVRLMLTYRNTRFDVA